MPISKSAKKALRASLKKEATNKPICSRLKKAVKKVRQNPDAKLLTEAFSALDKAVKKKIIRKGKANRTKSRLSRLLK